MNESFSTLCSTFGKDLGTMLIVIEIVLQLKDILSSACIVLLEITAKTSTPF